MSCKWCHGRRVILRMHNGRLTICPHCVPILSDGVDKARRNALDCRLGIMKEVARLAREVIDRDYPLDSA